LAILVSVDSIALLYLPEL
jgi:uncharacterized protein (TIGR02246 family)